MCAKKAVKERLKVGLKKLVLRSWSKEVISWSKKVGLKKLV